MAGNAENAQGVEWLCRLRTGDHRAFAELVDKYKSKVFLCCRTLGLKEDEAEDVASETFLSAYKGLSRYRGEGQLDTWLWRIAYNKGVSFIREKGRRAELVTEIPEEFSDNRNPRISARLESEEWAELLRKAMGRLPRVWAVAIVLFYREEKNVAEIAKIMRKRKNTIKTYLFRGRKRLKELLADVYGDDIDVGG